MKHLIVVHMTCTQPDNTSIGFNKIKHNKGVLKKCNYLGNPQIDKTVSPGSVKFFWISLRLLIKGRRLLIKFTLSSLA